MNVFEAFLDRQFAVLRKLLVLGANQQVGRVLLKSKE
jgi:hypothetical protein